MSFNLETTLFVRAALLYPSRLTSLIFSLLQDNVNPDSNSNIKKIEIKKNITNSPFSNYIFEVWLKLTCQLSKTKCLSKISATTWMIEFQRQLKKSKYKYNESIKGPSLWQYFQFWAQSIPSKESPQHKKRSFFIWSPKEIWCLNEYTYVTFDHFLSK